MRSGARLDAFARGQIWGMRQAGAKREAIAGAVRKKDGTKPTLRAVDGVLAKKKRQARAVHHLLIADMRLRLKRSAGAFRPWKMWMQDKKAKRGKIRKGLRNCTRVTLKFYMSVWSAQAQQGRRAVSAVRKMLNRHAAMAFAAWVRVLEIKHIRLQQLLASLTHWGDGFILSRGAF